MRIEIASHNATVNDALKKHVDRSFSRIAKQVNPSARLHLRLEKEQNPANEDSMEAEATLHMKGKMLVAHDASPDMAHSIERVAEKLSRQLERYLDKRRGPRD